IAFLDTRPLAPILPLGLLTVFGAIGVGRFAGIAPVAQRAAWARSSGIPTLDTGLLDALPMAAIVIDRHGVVAGANPAALALLDQSIETTLGAKAGDLLPPEIAATLTPSAASPVARDVTVGTEPTPRVWSTRQQPLRSPRGAVSGVLLTLEDVTETRRREAEANAGLVAASAANDRQGLVLARLSHELRTPLTAILGFTDLLTQDPTLTAEQHARIDAIEQAATMLHQLLEDVSDLVRAETGRLPLTIVPVDLAALIRETLTLVAPMAERQRVRVRWDDSACETALADPRRLQQALLNLLTNSVKYNRPGGVVTITMERRGGSRRIAIHDSGEGIAPEDLPRLFTPFERLGAERRGISGTGLGLIIAKGFVEAMRGAIGVHSTVGVGSTFWIELPAPPSPEPVASTPVALPPAGPVTDRVTPLTSGRVAG
ncbi:MAG: PAS domain-containing sensor histidine kinase, partial [Dehalococcoidia bacterium]|nr:PAS domain-containing sensor histidine kinase [Dehalococcoidia bacterium]